MSMQLLLFFEDLEVVQLYLFHTTKQRLEKSGQEVPTGLITQQLKSIQTEEAHSKPPWMD